jgi:RNA polymerase sigma-70 factor (ECF subfamily)
MRSKFKNEFDELWIQTTNKVRAYMFCACGSWPDADDMLQDCYLRALRGWGKFNGKASRQAWLFGIARRTCADWFRTKKRKGTAVGSVNLDDLEGRVSARSNADGIEAVWGAIKELGAEQSEVIGLRFAADLSYAEIGQTLGIPVGTVRSRLHRGLKAIRQKLKEKEDES